MPDLKTTRERVSESIVGRFVYWPAICFVPGLDPRAEHIQRRGVVLSHNKGSISVLLAMALDPYCPPEDDGRFLELEDGRYRLMPFMLRDLHEMHQRA